MYPLRVSISHSRRHFCLRLWFTVINGTQKKGTQGTVTEWLFIYFSHYSHLPCLVRVCELCHPATCQISFFKDGCHIWKTHSTSTNRRKSMVCPSLYVLVAYSEDSRSSFKHTPRLEWTSIPMQNKIEDVPFSPFPHSFKSHPIYFAWISGHNSQQENNSISCGILCGPWVPTSTISWKLVPKDLFCLHS